MYINVSLLFKCIMGVLGFTALVLLIILLVKLIKLISGLNKVVSDNSSNFNKACKALPAITSNAVEITDNVKGITDVATEATAEAIVAKDNLLSNYETVKDIINIIASVFSK